MVKSGKIGTYGLAVADIYENGSAEHAWKVVEFAVQYGSTRFWWSGTDKSDLGSSDGKYINVSTADGSDSGRSEA